MTKKLEDISSKELMETKISDLDLRLSKSFLAPLIKQVIQELREKSIKFKPHFWISDEWFCADGITGVAIPFFLIHPRLIALEKDQIGYVEGKSPQEALKILRHEVGHAIDNAFKLRNRRLTHKIFGKSSTKYPTHYEPMPYSKKFVKNLSDNYSQGHPTEDFAETFAVWLDPNSNWQIKYRGHSAQKKLKALDNLMKQEVINRRPSVNRDTVDSYEENQTTLKKYYLKKTKIYSTKKDHFWDRELLINFKNRPETAGKTKASRLIRKHKNFLTKYVAEECGERHFRTKKMVTSFASRAEELDLIVDEKSLNILPNLGYHIARKAKKFINQGKHLTPL